MGEELDVSGLMESIDMGALLKLLSRLKETDMNRVLDLASQVDLEKLLVLAKTVSDKSDTLVKFLETLEKLEGSGLLAMLDVIAESMDETFNAIARPPIMKALGNLMVLIGLFSEIDQGLLMELAENLPGCLEKARKVYLETDKGMGTFELLGMAKSPEIASSIRALQAVSKCLKEKCSRG